MEEKRDTQRVNITLYGLSAPIPFEIEPATEPVLREAAKILNGKIEDYTNRFPDKTLTELLYLCLLQEKMKLLENERDNSADKIVKELENIDKQLGEYISSR
ncbi:MAG: cell division protein ZapA [Bacteroidales bacterium]|nr:cell division protein ZapA [Bacteroidales bacterium]